MIKASTTKFFRLTACALFLTVLSSCSDDKADISAESAGHKPEVKSDIRRSKTLDGLASVESSETHSHESTDNGSQKVADSDLSPEREFEESSESTQLDEQYDEQFYDEPSPTVSFDSQPSEGVIRWVQPQNLAYTNAKITISSDSGETIVRDFSSGEAIELYGELPDGVYGWESVITPEVDESVRAEMRAVRSSGDINAERELAARLRDEGSLPTEQQARDNVQSGSFIVLNGIVSPRGVSEPNEVE